MKTSVSSAPLIESIAYKKGGDAALDARLRRAAAAQGLRLMKSRSRDPDALGSGGFMLVDGTTRGAVLGFQPWTFSADLEDVAQYLAAA